MFFRNHNFQKKDPFILQVLRTKERGVKRNFIEWIAPVKFSQEQEGEYSGLEGKTDFLGKMPNVPKRVKILFFLILICLFILFSRTLSLQILRQQYYLSVSEGNRIAKQTIKAQRGVILDRNQKLLVQNVPSFLISLNPTLLPQEKEERKKIIQELSERLGKDILVSEIEQKASENRNNPNFLIVLMENVEYEKAILFLLEKEQWPFLNVEAASIRQYQNENGKLLSLSHLLGYQGIISEKEIQDLSQKGYGYTDYIGKTGLEKFYEEILRGKNGFEQIEVDALGRQKQKLAHEEPLAGKNLILSIDFELQKFTEEILKQYLERSKREKGIIIVLDPRNGEILSLVSLPSYDNNFFASGINSEKYSQLSNHPSAPLFNRAISGEYPSGSTFKPIIAVAALEEGIVSPRTTVLSSGGIRIGKWFFPDWKVGGHGATNLKKALAESVNTYFYFVGGGYGDFTGLGNDRIVSYSKKFGFGQKTGIDLPSEADGFLPTKEWKEQEKNESWYIGDTYHLAIGQGDILVTPLQIAVMTMILANKGVYYQPHLARATVSGGIEEESENNIVRRQFVKEQNLEAVREGMRSAVKEGSARALNSFPFAIAGKTGTAQWSTKKEPHAWFTSFAPYENPEIAVTVLIEEGGEGSSVAVPLAREIYQRLMVGN